MAMLPSPEIATCTRTGSPDCTRRWSTVVLISNCPTAPANDGGAPSGSGCTSMVTDGAVTSRSSKRCAKGEKKGAKGSLEKLRSVRIRSTVNSIGASSRAPERVGKRAIRRMVTAS